MRKVFLSIAFAAICLAYSETSLAQNSTACAGDTAGDNAGTLDHIVFDLVSTSSSNGLIVWVQATTINSQTAIGSEQFVVPFSFPQFEIIYAQLLQVQKNTARWTIDFHKDSQNILCTMTVTEKYTVPSAAGSQTDMTDTPMPETQGDAPFE